MSRPRRILPFLLVDEFSRNCGTVPHHVDLVVELLRVIRTHPLDLVVVFPAAAEKFPRFPFDWNIAKTYAFKDYIRRPPGHLLQYYEKFLSPFGFCLSI